MDFSEKTPFPKDPFSEPDKPFAKPWALVTGRMHGSALFIALALDLIVVNQEHSIWEKLAPRSSRKPSQLLSLWEHPRLT